MTAAWTDFRPQALLQLLASRGVDHVVVGGFAAVLHGPGYERLRAGAETVDLGELAVRIASLDDLISMKRSADRPKDRADVVELEAIGRLRQRGA